jgi:hypothetical protein
MRVTLSVDPAIHATVRQHSGSEIRLTDLSHSLRSDVFNNDGHVPMQFDQLLERNILRGSALSRSNMFIDIAMYCLGLVFLIRLYVHHKLLLFDLDRPVYTTAGLLDVVHARKLSMSEQYVLFQSPQSTGHLLV